MLPLPVRATRRSPGKVILSKKLLGGSEMMRSFWPGRFTLVLQPSARLEGHPDAVEVDPRALDFDLQVLPFNSGEFLELLATTDIVSFLLTDRSRVVADNCLRLGIPGVLITEATLKTRARIDVAGKLKLGKRLRRLASATMEEARTRWAIRHMAGFQANGTPTYDAYRKLNSDALLYFDSRVTEDLIVSEAALERRLQRLRGPGPLRLVFSGRLTEIKGADDLPEVARRLRDRGLDFKLDIYGSGDQEWVVQRKIDRYGLSERVQVHGSLDFRTELMPTVARDADLFVCCHRQGDPSCTYLETFACGVPVVGYKNEALGGMLDRVVAGKVSPMDQPERLADMIFALSKRPEKIARMAQAGRGFSLGHTFRETFKARMDHLLGVYERSLS